MVRIVPPIKLNLNDTARRIKTIPRYIGFLEYLKTPETTKEVALSIFIGLIVVCCALNDLAADIRVTGPTIISNKLKTFKITLLKSGNKGLEK